MEKRYFFQKLNKNNQGFSLVELLIALGIMSIVCAMAFGFMSTSSKLFSKTNAEVNIQSEAQSAANAIKELIIDCQVSVDYFDTKSDSTRVFTDNGVEYKNVLLVNNNDEQFLIYQNPAQSDELLFLSRKRNETTGKFDISFNPNDAEVLAEYVSEFKVDTSRFEKTKIIDFSFIYTLRGKKYEGTYQVRMRNDITIDSNTDYEKKNEEKVTQVIVTPATYEMTPNLTSSTTIVDDVQFTGVVRTTGTLNTDKTWAILPSVAGCSIDENGLMTMTAEPSVESFKVIATSVQNPDISGSATVKVKKVTNLSILAVSGITGALDGVESANMNSKVLFAGVVDGWNLTSKDQSVIWKLEYKPRYDLAGDYTELTYYDTSTKTYVNTKPEVGFINAGGLLTIGKNAANNYEFKITATATFPNYGKPATYMSTSTLLRVKNANVDFDGNFIRGYNVNIKNYFLSGKAAVDGNIDSDITEINGYDSASYYDGSSWKNLLVDSGQLANGILYVDSSAFQYSDASANKKFYDSLNVKVKIRDQNGDAKEIKLTLPAVSMAKGEPTSSYIVVSKGSTVDIPFTYTGINVTAASQIGIYIDGEKVSTSGSSSVNKYLSSYLQTTKSDGSSALGTKDSYAYTQTVRLAANSTDRHYPKEKSSLIITMDDFYQVSSKAANSYIEYDVYVANVEGQKLFIPGPGTTGFPSVSSTKTQYTVGPDNTSVQMYKSGSKYYMVYSAKTYVYDDVYLYWKLK